MRKLVCAAFVFLLGSSLFAQTDMGRYREVKVDDTFGFHVLKSQRCADANAADRFWASNVFLWNQKSVINNQQDAKDYPDAYWKQASPEMFEWAWTNKQHFENGTAYVIRVVSNLNNEFRIISQRLIYFSPDEKSVWYYYCLESLFEHY